MVTFQRDSKGLAQLLRSDPVRRALGPYAEKVAAEVRKEHPDAEVVVDDYTTDRAAKSITIKDAMGRLWQVRDGVLTRAARKAGLEVRAKK